MADQLPKINRIRSFIDQYAPACELEVDGGIDVNTAPLCVQAGANVLVAGSAIFGKTDRISAVHALRRSVGL